MPGYLHWSLKQTQTTHKNLNLKPSLAGTRKLPFLSPQKWIDKRLRSSVVCTSANAQFSHCFWDFHPVQTGIMQKPPPGPAPLSEYPVSTWFISSSDGRWPKSKVPVCSLIQNQKLLGLRIIPLGPDRSCLNRFSPDSSLLPVHVGCKPKSFAKPGGWSCVFWGLTFSSAQTGEM